MINKDSEAIPPKRRSYREIQIKLVLTYQLGEGSLPFIDQWTSDELIRIFYTTIMFG